MSSFLLLLWAPVQTVGWAEPSSLANTHLSSLGTVGPQCWKAWAEPSHQFLLFFLEIRFLYLITGLPWWLSGKESPCQWRRLRKRGYEGDSRNMSLIPWIRKIPWRRKWQPTPVFLLGESYGQRNLVGYSPWGHKESEMTEQLSVHTHTHLITPPKDFGLPCWLRWVKKCACNAGDPGSIPGFGRSPGEGNDNPPQYSCLENSMDRGTWQYTVHRVTKSWTWLSD